MINHLRAIAWNHSEFKGACVGDDDVAQESEVDVGIGIDPRSRSGSEGVIMENDVVFCYAFVFCFLLSDQELLGFA